MITRLFSKSVHLEYSAVVFLRALVLDYRIGYTIIKVGVYLYCWIPMVKVDSYIVYLNRNILFHCQSPVLWIGLVIVQRGS